MNPTSGRDHGSSSLVVVLAAPILAALMFMGFQAALWNHTRTEARVVAREAAVLVAREGVSVADASTAVRASIDAGSLLESAAVDIRIEAQMVVVTVTGRALGVLRFTSVPMTVSTSLPREGWVPL